jgi:hypothetical protein
MKNLKILLILMLCASNIFAQVTTFTPGKAISKSNTGAESLQLIGTSNQTDLMGTGIGGTLEVPTATQNNSNLLSLLGAGHTGVAFTNSAKSKIIFQATQNWSVGSTGSNMTFWTTPNNTITSLQRMTITNAGKIGIGTDSPGYNLEIIQDTPSDDGVGLKRFGGDAPSYFGIGARGTSGSPTASLTSDILGRFGGRGHNGTAFTTTRGRIEFVTNENWTSTANGTDIKFFTTQPTTTTATEKMIINGNGNVGIGTSAPTSKLTINGDYAVKVKTISTGGSITSLVRESSSVLYFNNVGTVNLRGIAGGEDGLVLHIFCSSSTTLNIFDDDTAATADKRIWTQTSSTVTISGRGGCTMIYDAFNTRWRVIGIAF